MDIKKEYLAPGIVAYYDVMENPQDFISDVEGLVEINNLTWIPGTTRDVNDSNPATSNVSSTVRDVETIGLLSFDRRPELKQNATGPGLQLHDYLNETVYPVAKDYAVEHGILSYATGENWQILKYGKGHHFANHVDDSKMYPRTFSISYYLNDDYEGGEIEFPRFDLKIKPIANQAIVFPANYAYNHKIYPVTSGTRYTVVNWFE